LDRADSTGKIIGAAFLLEYRNLIYIISAKHVIDFDNPSMAFARKDGKVAGLKTSTLQRGGLGWLMHPGDLDLAAIPFYGPAKGIDSLDFMMILEDKWATQPIVKVGSRVVHLGYPEGRSLPYTDRKRSPFPLGMPGKVIKLDRQFIVMETVGLPGASGGPVFMKSDNKPHLIGVTIEVKAFGKRTRPGGAAFLNKTKALPISLVKDILDSQEMKEMIRPFEGRQDP
jgi:hypothetical protein